MEVEKWDYSCRLTEPTATVALAGQAQLRGPSRWPLTAYSVGARPRHAQCAVTASACAMATLPMAQRWLKHGTICGEMD
jgi:hypothetical protein